MTSGECDQTIGQNRSFKAMHGVSVSNIIVFSVPGNDDYGRTKLRENSFEFIHGRVEQKACRKAVRKRIDQQTPLVTVQGGWTKREKWFMIFLDASKEHRSQGSRGTTVGKPGPMLPGEPESEKAAGASRATAARE